MESYMIVRRFRLHPEENMVVKTGLTREEAKEHCNDPNTSSKTCTNADRALTEKFGDWFDSFEEE